MKKLLSVILSIVLCISLQASNSDFGVNIGTYISQCGVQSNIVADYNNSNELLLCLDVNGDNGKTMLILKSEYSIFLFTDALSLCKKKYNEWKRIVKEHKANDVFKEMEILFPPGFLLWDNGNAANSKVNISSAFAAQDGLFVLSEGGFAENDISNGKKAQTVWGVYFLTNKR